MEVKACSSCLYFKDISKFNKNKISKDKYDYLCKECAIKKAIHYAKLSKVECSCGKMIFKSDYSKHIKRDIHFKWLKIKSINNIAITV